MKTYRGIRFDDGSMTVRVEELNNDGAHGYDLDIRWSLTLRQYVDFFAWGFLASSGQLALAMLLDAVNDGSRTKSSCEALALRHAPEWSHDVIWQLDSRMGWAISQEEILLWLNTRAKT